MECNDKTGLSTSQYEVAPCPPTTSAIITEVMRPFMQAMGKMLEKNVEAIDRLSAAQTIQNDRLEALEKQIRLQTPVTAKQAQFLNDAIRAKARELLDKRGLADNKKAVTRLGNCIRKDVLARYGIAGLREIPRHEYQVAMSQIGMWSNALTLRDIVREAREYVQVVEMAGQASGVDGAQAVSGADHQHDNLDNAQIHETGRRGIEL